MGAAWWWGWLLSAAGLTVLWLAGNRRRFAWALGVAIQGLWATYAITTDQPGFLVSVAAYGTVYARNWWRWRPPTDNQQPPRPCRCDPHQATCPTGAAEQPHTMVGPAGDVFYPDSPDDARWLAREHDAAPLHPNRFPDGWLP